MEKSPVPEGMVVTERTSSRFRVVDSENTAYYLDAVLADGVLSFELVAVANGQ